MHRRVIHTQVSILLQTPLPSRLPQSTEQSSMSLLVIRVKYRSVLMSIPSSLTTPFPHPSLMVTMNSFSKSVSLFSK